MNATERWEQGIDHYPEVVKMIKMVRTLDTDDSLDLKMGGDGDTGETLAYFLDVLIQSGKLKIVV